MWTTWRPWLTIPRARPTTRCIMGRALNAVGLPLRAGAPALLLCTAFLAMPAPLVLAQNTLVPEGVSR